MNAICMHLCLYVCMYVSLCVCAYHDFYNLREYMNLNGYSENANLRKFQEINNIKRVLPRK